MNFLLEQLSFGMYKRRSYQCLQLQTRNMKDKLTSYIINSKICYLGIPVENNTNIKIYSKIESRLCCFIN